MRRLYGDRSTAHIVVDLFASEWVVQDVYVKSQFRKEGRATDLMQELCADADAEGETLVLSVWPDGTGMTASQLLKWYAKFGFYCDQITRNPRHMKRKPQNDRSDACPSE